ncbi:hypothetical protein SAMN06273572_101736 [Monaibacterium marinum]|uniref:Type IV pilus biogenesis n=1 Tax=Pontivivens marinum TaxID=1690039 RepID=A0A2C9CNX3_9RHOB|nr:hypothetical protein SAMN06273572_101736 [Monaibacterium marinum]
MYDRARCRPTGKENDVHASRSNWTLWITLAATMMATGGLAYERAGISHAAQVESPLTADIPHAGYLPRPAPSGAGYRVAQAGEVLELSIRPRPRPTGLTLTGLVGESAASGEPVYTDASGTIIRPQPRPQGTTVVAADSAPDPQQEVTTAGLTPDVVEDILRPQPRPAGFAQSVRAAAATRDVAPVLQQNQSTPTTATVREAVSGPNQIALDRITLIGVFGTDEARRALLRTPEGDFQPVARGTVVQGWRVLTIDRETVRIGRNAEVMLLELP